MSTGATLALLARLFVSLGVVIGLMWFAARVVRRRGLGGFGSPTRRPGVHIDVLARRTLSRNTSIAIVRVGGQGLIVGVTDHQVTKLADADLDELDLDDAEGQWTASSQGPDGPTPSWKAMLDGLRERTVRR
ncbi:MAG: flagellar biosynthetic protein FliO [Acidimicrobiia bacterium]